jgi:hypothetical protein
MIAICREHAANVKRRRDGQMVLRWVAAGMGEAAKQFRRVNGHLHLPALRATLDQTVLLSHPPRRMPPDHPRGPPPKFHGERDILSSRRSGRAAHRTLPARTTRKTASKASTTPNLISVSV